MLIWNAGYRALLNKGSVGAAVIGLSRSIMASMRFCQARVFLAKSLNVVTIYPKPRSVSWSL